MKVASPAMVATSPILPPPVSVAKERDACLHVTEAGATAWQADRDRERREAKLGVVPRSPACLQRPG